MARHLLPLLGALGLLLSGPGGASAAGPSLPGLHSSFGLHSSLGLHSLRGHAARVAAQAAYGRLPLQFEENRGQADPAVAFLSRGPGYSLFLTPRQAVFALSRPGRGASPGVLRMTLEGANPAPALSGGGRLPGVVNYLAGPDARTWHTRIPTFRQVRYSSVYPGIDLVYYGNQRQLEYDFAVAPGGDARAIRLALEGARRARIDAHGDLVLGLAGGQLHWKRPTAYQDAGGRRRPVPVKYVLGRGSTVGFRLGAHDPHAALVIDPVVSYSSYLGGSEFDDGYGIAADGDGNAYVTGINEFLPFPTTPGSYQPDGSGVFVAKINAAGTGFVYSTHIGNYGSNAGYGIAVDRAGDAFVTGKAAPNFPTTAGAYQATSTYGGAFVAELDSTGSTLLYSTYLTYADYADWGSAIAVDPSGAAWVTGQTNGGFPTTADALQPRFAGGSDAFVAKIDPTQAGTASLVYATYLGGSSANGDAGLGIAVDQSGAAYVTGQTSSNNFPTTAGAYQRAFAGGRAFGDSGTGPDFSGFGDAFVAKFSATGTLVYSTYLGGGAGTQPDDFARAIAVDAAGCAYVTGQTASVNFPTTAGAYNTSSLGASFLTKLSANGSSLVYSTYIGGDGYTRAVGVDAKGNAYVAGTTEGTVPTTGDAFQPAYGGGGTFDGEGDAFFEQFDARGAHLLYATYLGGSRIDAGYGLAVDAAGAVYLTGGTPSDNFPTTTGAFQPAFGGVGVNGDRGDAFVAKFLTVLPPVISALTASPPGLQPASATAGGGDFVLTVRGTGFDPQAVITFGGTALATTVVSATQATALVPAALIAQTGAPPVTIANPAPGGTSNAVPFTVGAAHWAVRAMAAGDDGRTRLLWDNTDGSATVWTLDAAGNHTASSAVFGPYAGWTARKLAAAPGGATRLLWTNADGTAIVWNLSSALADTANSPVLGPYSGWSAQAVSVGTDGGTRLLWDNTDGSVIVWSLSPAGVQTGASPVYGPFAGWSGRAVSTGPDGGTRLLWTNTDGSAIVWTLSSALTDGANSAVFGPFAGWSGADLSVGHDNTARLLWTNLDGSAIVWALSAAGAHGTDSPIFGPYAGWGALAVSVGSDGGPRLLWGNTGGSAIVWTLSAAGAHASDSPIYGPY